MYIRHHGNYASPKTKQPYGIFVVIYHLYRDGKLSESDIKLYLDTKEWFEQNLPNPPFYDDNNSVHAVTWFKDENKTPEMRFHLQSFIDMAKKYNVEIMRSMSKELPGILIYEDEYQIGIIFGEPNELVRKNMNMNIVLVGMSGAGKSTLGVLLAKALGMDFVDTDIVIQQHEGRLLQEIIDHDGIERFLDIEERIVSELQLKNCVISTGGSVIYSEKAMNILQQHGQIIYLHVPYEEIQRRLKNVTTRGIVIKKGNTLKDVYEERVPLYAKFSDTTIDCSNKEIEQCISEMIGLVSWKGV